MQIDPPTIPRFQALRRASYAARVLREMQGIQDRTCNLCGFRGKFSAAGRPPRYDAKCPRCQSVERHRLVVLACEALGVPKSTKTLHFAPEPALRAWLKLMSDAYQSADIMDGRADLTLDIEHLDPDYGPYDLIVASHVLEHVDDGLALGSLFTALRPGGRLLILTPIIEGWAESHEDPRVTDPHDRLVHFGQEDHVRYYGRDLRQRITQAGFLLSEYTAPASTAVEFGLSRGETVFLAQRPAAD